MTEEITVPGSYVKALLGSNEIRGFDVDVLLCLAEISREEIDSEEDFPSLRFGRLYQLPMREVRDESFGMIRASTVPTGSFRMMCFACIRAKNLEIAVRRCGDFLRNLAR